MEIQIVWNFESSFRFKTFKSSEKKEKKRKEGKKVISKDFFQELMIRIGSNKFVIAKIESRVV